MAAARFRKLGKLNARQAVTDLIEAAFEGWTTDRFKRLAQVEAQPPAMKVTFPTKTQMYTELSFYDCEHRGESWVRLQCSPQWERDIDVPPEGTPECEVLRCRGSEGLKDIVWLKVPEKVSRLERAIRELLPQSESDTMCRLIAKAHIAVMQLLARNMQEWGVFIGANRWWYDFLSNVETRLGQEPRGVFEACAIEYAAHLRVEDARTAVLAEFEQLRGTVSFDAGQAQAAAAKRAHDQRPYPPIALTARFRRGLMQLARALRMQLPALVTGEVGSGKSALALALSTLSGVEVIRQVYMTGETEAPLLVGSFLPEGNEIKWSNGIITTAIVEGQWVLMDNMGDADSCVLERMNPCLEAPVDWRLVEKGEDWPQVVHPAHRFIGTMTTAPAGQAEPLSPALYNRFNIVQLDALSVDNERIFLDEIGAIARTSLGDAANDAEVRAITSVCWWVWTKRELRDLTIGAVAQPLTFRTITRFLDSTYRLWCARELPLSAAIKASFDTIVCGLYKESSTDQLMAIGKEFKEMTTRFGLASSDEPARVTTHFDTVLTEMMSSNATVDRDMIITPSRAIYAKQVILAVECNLPVLLEGPAAVGKTAVIAALVKQSRKLQKASGHASNELSLYRVNNTATTTIQDYLGSFLPKGGGFDYRPGALVMAMETGSWFLADEFNLADPSIMSVLGPLLEGKGSLLVQRGPGRDTVKAKPGFRFFATQNNAGYAGRNKLPPTLRSRFIEVQVKDFAKNDIDQIFQRKVDPDYGLEMEHAKPISVVYEALAKLGHHGDKRPTMRDLVKWVKKRHAYFYCHTPTSKRCPPEELLFCSGLSLMLNRCEETEQREMVVSAFKDAFTSVAAKEQASTAEFSP